MICFSAACNVKSSADFKSSETTQKGSGLLCRLGRDLIPLGVSSFPTAMEKRRIIQSLGVHSSIDNIDPICLGIFFSEFSDETRDSRLYDQEHAIFVSRGRRGTSRRREKREANRANFLQGCLLRVHPRFFRFTRSYKKAFR